MARTDTTWTNRSGEYIETNKPTGYHVLINGENRYLNFNSIVGSLGYGIRDNNGTMQFKNLSGSWTDFGSGGGGTWGTITGTITDQTDLITYLSTNYQPVGSYLTEETDPVFSAWLLATPPAYPGDIPDVSVYELLSNKSTNVITDGASDTKYPSVKAIKDYADGLVAGLLDYRGGYDASGNTYPTTGGSGSAGAVLKGDMWIISVAGTLGSVAVQVGDSIIANVDTPGQTASNWNILNSNISYVPEDVANKENTTIDTSTTKYPTVNLLKTGLDTKQATLVSGTNIKTINGSSVLGSGDLSTTQTTITGNAGTATALQTARIINGVLFDGTTNITVPVNNTDDTTTNATMYPLFTATAGGNYAAKVSTTKLSFNPSTGSLTATNFYGNGANLTSLTAGQLSGTIPSAVTATTQSANDNSTKIATTAYVDGKTFSSTIWTAITGTRASNTTITVSGDQTALFKKGTIVKWQESGVDRVGMVSIPSVYSDPNTTITIIGNTCASIDSNSFKYSNMVSVFKKSFAVAGNIGATGTDVTNAWYADKPYHVIGAELAVGFAGTTNSTTIDINKNGTTMFTTKPSLATTVAFATTPFTADTATTLALGDRVSVDIDGFQTTNAKDLYPDLLVFETRYLTLS